MMQTASKGHVMTERALALAAAIAALVAAVTSLFNGWQIARLTGRVDAIEATMQTVLTLLAGGAS